MSTFLFHPPVITVKIIGTDCSTHSRLCYAHHICGSLLTLDVVVRLRRLQIVDNGKERSVIAAYHVTDGIDSCCVGFLKRADKVQQTLRRRLACLQASLTLSDLPSMFRCMVLTEAIFSNKVKLRLFFTCVLRSAAGLGMSVSSSSSSSVSAS